MSDDRREAGSPGVKALTLLLLLCAWLAPGCQRVPPEYETFLELPPNRQQEEMRKLPHEKQLEYYFAGLKYAHPPKMSLANPIAEQGKAVLPFLLGRLRAEKNEAAKANIVLLLEVMHVSYYSLKGEKEVTSLLEETTANAKDPELRRRGGEALQLILHDRPPDPVKLLDGEEGQPSP